MPDKPNQPHIFEKIKRLEIKTKRLVEGDVSGKYHSLFKGSGISFSAVREYDMSDDSRLIDWRVSARTGRPHVKLFEEERNLNVILAVDKSASVLFGSTHQDKASLAAELSAALGFSAAMNQDHVGWLLFAGKVIQYRPAKKGRQHVGQLLHDLYSKTDHSGGTDIAEALRYLSTVLKKRSIIFLLSDFLNHGYEKNMGILARKHDIVPIVLEDPRELRLPKVGLVTLEDPETKEQVFINTNSLDIRQRYEALVYARAVSRDRIFKSLKLEPLILNTAQDYLKPLHLYFKRRITRLNTRF